MRERLKMLLESNVRDVWAELLEAALLLPVLPLAAVRSHFNIARRSDDQFSYAPLLLPLFPLLALALAAALVAAAAAAVTVTVLTAVCAILLINHRMQDG